MPLIQDYNKLFEHTDDIKKVILNGNIVWPAEKPAGPDYTEPFYVENTTEGATNLVFYKESGAPTFDVYYSYDNMDWTSHFSTGATYGFVLNAGQKIYFKANTSAWANSSSSGGYIHINGCNKIGGNIMSLLYGSNFTGQETSFPNGSTGAFYGLFYGNTILDDVSELILPATTLAERCYDSLFYNCTSLVTAPDLHAPTLVAGCYHHLFYGCTSLNKVTCYATSGINENDSTTNWLYNVASTGVVYLGSSGSATWPYNTPNGIPSGWGIGIIPNT